ncbi:MAG TPA: amidohydrolase family protein [Candidatus Baltobacteraceae bacterium]|nr:amidohydrolase family protein [Candidatus Baltobacteraceae bacterium]
MALVVRANTIVTNASAPAQQAVTFEALGSIRDGALVVDDGRVAWSGSAGDLPAEYRSADLHEYRDCVIVPGFIDAHAHPLFAGDREPDFAARQRGEKAPLGMLYTVAQTRKALERPQSFWPLIEQRLRTIAAHGTTTLETKTGYALHKPGEMDLLTLIDQHRDESATPRLVATFLGAHALPPEFTSESDYVDYLIDQCMPFAKAHGAVYADAFCEPGFFSPGQTRRYLEAARAHGLRLRVHCDEMAYGAAARMAAELGVDAVDHCNCINEEDVEAIARREIVTVACPATIAYLDLPQRAPVRALLARGAMVALASDYNPGTSPCFNLQTVAFFGRKIFGLSAAEALYGVTVAAARSLRIDAGTLRQGARADFVALRLASPEEFGWQFGGNLAAAVYRGGRPVA